MGTTVIRAFNDSKRFVDLNDELVNANNNAIHSFLSVGRWLGVRLELLGSVVTLAVGIVAFLARDEVRLIMFLHLLVPTSMSLWGSDVWVAGRFSHSVVPKLCD